MAFVEFVTLLIFIAILSKAAEAVVENAEKLALFFGVSTLAIGMLLVAVSTTLPELSVSIISSSAKQGEIAAGNAFGSIITNILLILGAGAFLYGFKVGQENLPDLALVLMLTTLISVYVLFHSLVAGNALSFPEGLLLLLIFAWYANRMIKKKRIPLTPYERLSKSEGLRAFLLFCLGIIVVLISSNFVVDSAVKLAEIAGLAKSFIGATLIAVGTSLPEISISLQAIKKKQYGLALGDAIGANMSNITLVLGTAAAISPIAVQLNVFSAALLFAVASNFLFLYFAVVDKKFTRKNGLVMLGLYLLYLILIFALQFSELEVIRS
ncbi:MAG: sodium:calcium antiporter [Candidatus Micrarchaeota archaeon]|nr:sodium:calcium antiporter [Candidatus Micrarchaeota archaeon]